eukprot:1100398-Pyramimonas_sp.AAC.1
MSGLLLAENPQHVRLVEHAPLRLVRSPEFLEPLGREALDLDLSAARGQRRPLPVTVLGVLEDRALPAAH